MNAELERNFRNIGVLGQLAQNDKLMTEGEVFAIYIPTSTRGVWRKWYGETREINLVKIQQCVRECKQFVTGVLAEDQACRTEQATFASKLHLQTQMQWCTRMNSKLRRAIEGLKNMQLTYRDDASISCKIELLVEEIRDFLESTDTLTQRSSPASDSPPAYARFVLDDHGAVGS